MAPLIPRLRGTCEIPAAQELPDIPATETEPIAAQHDAESAKFDLTCELNFPQGEYYEENFFHVLTEVTKQRRPEYWSLANISGPDSRYHDDIVAKLADMVDPSTLVPHINWNGKTEDEITARLDVYDDEGISRIIVSPPETGLSDYQTRQFDNDPFSAIPLLRLAIEHAASFSVGVAVYTEGHPRIKNSPPDELKRIAGELYVADFVVTKPVFRAEPAANLARFIADNGADKPMHAGIMPFRHPRLAEEIADSYNARFHTEKLDRMIEESKRIIDEQTEGLDEAVRINESQRAIRDTCLEFTASLGVDLITKLGAAGLHIYTGNHAKLTVDTLAILGH